MLKTLMITTATVALFAGSAVAQDTTQRTSPTITATAGTTHVITQQTADQWLASKFKGTDVIGADNAKIGDVTDVVFDKQNKVVAYVIGVGGFLGIGSKDVALTPDSFQVQPATDKEYMKLKLSMTKDELKNAAAFQPRKEPTATTGMAPRDRAPVTPRQ